MIELIILKYLLILENYNKFRYHINIRDNRELEQLYTILDTMMDTYKRDISTDEYIVVANNENSELTFWTDQLDGQDIGEEILSDLVQRIVQKTWAHNHALVSIDVAEGRASIEAIGDHFDTLIEKPIEEIEYVTDNLEELVNETIATRGLRWRLNSLNLSLGSLRKGDFGFIFARPETGKTTFLASEVTNFASQCSSPILWFNNEEQGNKVKIRCYQASLALTSRELLKIDKQQAIRKYKEDTKSMIHMIDQASMHKSFIERVCRDVNPSLIIFDQIDKIKGFKEDREDLRLGGVYTWARELAKKYGPVIGVCQSDVSGEGRRWLTMDNVANAKCLDPLTKVLMYNGEWKPISLIEKGERVMGVDSTPREVLAITSGIEDRFSVQHIIGGDEYIVNKSHILSLINASGKYVNKNVLEYKNQDFGYRVGHELPEQDLPIDPYFLGVWLGDGGKDKAEITTIDEEIIQTVKDQCSKWNCTYTQYIEKERIIHAKMKYKRGIRHPFLNELKRLGLYKYKHIPKQYFKGSIEQRLQLIAGLIDTDGTKAIKQHEYYSFSNVNHLIAFGLKTLALSCGLMSTIKQRGKYHYVHISANNLSIIPCKIKRKKSVYISYKDVLKSRLKITKIERGKYAGILIDGDHKFIIENNIVTHNTSKQAEADWILGIGCTHNTGLDHLRYLHLSKNKLMGDEDTDPTKRHARIECILQPEIARYRDF